MSKSSLKLTKNNVINCILYTVIGLLLVIMKGGSLNILMTIIGALFIIKGIVELINGEIIPGIVEAVVGVAIIVCGWTIADIVLLIFGILLIVKGLIDLIKNTKAGFVPVLSAIVTIVIGVLLVVAKWVLLDVMCIVAGVIFLINAVLALFGKSLKK